MSMTCLEAKVGSVYKWWRIRWDGGCDEGIDNCPLCSLYFHQDCYDCPVMIKTGRVLCGGTPYDSGCDNDPINIIQERRRATRELNFLYSLITVKQRNKALAIARKSEYNPKFIKWMEGRICIAK